jgi:hypothetical protein
VENVYCWKIPDELKLLATTRISECNRRIEYQSKGLERRRGAHGLATLPLQARLGKRRMALQTRAFAGLGFCATYGKAITPRGQAPFHTSPESWADTPITSGIGPVNFSDYLAFSTIFLCFEGWWPGAQFPLLPRAIRFGAVRCGTTQKTRSFPSYRPTALPAK